MTSSSRTSLLAITATASLLLAGNNCANALDLTEANFSEMTSGKTVFLKMYAPWCGHCKSMAGDWAKLEADFEGHPVALVGSVDCTADESEGICADFQVQVRLLCRVFCVFCGCDDVSCCIKYNALER